MQRFAELLDKLVYTQSRNRKLSVLQDYFRQTPDPDRGWALAALTGELPLRVPLRRLLSNLLDGIIDPQLYRLSRDYVGDTAETVSLLWPEPTPQPRRIAEASGDTVSLQHQATSPSLDTVIATFTNEPRATHADHLRTFLDCLDTSGRFALLKLLGGAPRVGVSARLAKTAIAQAYDHDVADVEEIWHAVEPPYPELFAWLEGKAERPDPEGRPVFRPLMLAHPVEDEDWKKLSAEDLIAEWKWDGIRVQLAAIPGEARLYSRTGDDISATFPELISAFETMNCVVDGELLILRDTSEVAPFNDLQQRLNRKTVSARMLRELPAHIRLYDLLFEDGTDLRDLPFVERRERLERWHAANHPPLSDVSRIVPFSGFDDLRRIWEATRADEIEGLMLKQKQSRYIAGRPKGHWWKWKRAPLTLDCVLMYAQRGSGKRSSYYSDYTFGVWADPQADDESGLVPVGKAYSGFTDEELVRLDKFVRDHTLERFGPVRSVEPGLVLEVAFDAVHRSPRHKSGIAMRFPRISRIRWDKPVEEADRLETVQALLPTADR